MNETNIVRDALRAVLFMGAGGLVFLGIVGGLGFFISDKAFHGESSALSAAAASAKDAKAPSKKPAREGKTN